ncbi:MAG TPA: ABC transporter ATP-binding protein [Candidatus Acidoferrum sp.]|nr:ABC transporter ATP-binding protein [Candidatus Acidoferrum sp.]
MNYALNNQPPRPKASVLQALRGLIPLLEGERIIILYASLATLTNSLVNLAAPLLVAHVVDTYILAKQFDGMLRYASLLFLLYTAALCTSYIHTRLMGSVGQRVMFSVRSRIFGKLQELPLAFFHANKTGDLISRINNDTDKLNVFFSQTLVQFMGSIVVMTGAGIFVLVINFKLGVAALAPAAVLVLFTRSISPWIKKRNAEAMAATGGLSAEVNESLGNFRVIVAFNRRDFFRARFEAANKQNYDKAIRAGIANIVFTPVFQLSSMMAQMLVLVFGVKLIQSGEFTAGLLISYLSYVTFFYNPLRQLAMLWANFQVALAGWDRIEAILQMHNDMPLLPAAAPVTGAALLEFRQASFSYTPERKILDNLALRLERGKTYALVGPTGGGKTTTASLMARLYDPTDGTVLFDGRDIRTVPATERARRIGFILQEPVLFSGTVRDNVLYGNDEYAKLDDAALLKVLEDAGLAGLLQRFDGGLAAKVASGGDALSLGQKQLLAFMRAVLHHPDLLILDEATANIDTVTEQLLEAILHKLPAHTTRVIIAHRLNTIENADEIFFVNGAEITKASSMQEAVDMLLHRQKAS